MNRRPSTRARPEGSAEGAALAPRIGLDPAPGDDKPPDPGDTGGGTAAIPGQLIGNRIDAKGNQAGRALPAPICCLFHVATDRRESLLSQMVESLKAQSVVHDSGMVLSLLLEREKLGSTAIGKGVAVPHARSLTVTSLQLAVATSRHGIPWDAPDGDPVRLVFMVLAPSMERARKPYLDLIAQIAERTRLARSRKRLLGATTLEEVVSAMGGSP